MKISKGDRIAQLIFEKCLHDVEFIENGPLDTTKRGEKSFDFTGVKPVDTNDVVQDDEKGYDTVDKVAAIDLSISRDIPDGV